MERPMAVAPAFPPDAESLSALRGELIGSRVLIDKAPGVEPLPVEGTIVDESLHTFLLRLPGRSRLRRIPKAGLSGTIVLGGRELPLRGDALRMRPEDRTKRLSFAGRRKLA